MRLIVPFSITAACLITSTVGFPAIVQQQPLLSTNQSLQEDKSLTVQYSGYQVIEVMANTDQQLSALDALRQTFALDFWTPLSLEKPIKIRLSPEQQSKFFEQLPANTNYSVVIQDLQTFLDQRHKTKLDINNNIAHENFFSDFHSYENITSFMNELTTRHSKLVKKFQIGNTSEGRPIYAWTVHKKAKKGKKNKKSKKADEVSSWLGTMADRVFDWLEERLEPSNFGLDDDDDDEVDVDLLQEPEINMSKKKHKKKNRKPMEIIINGGQHGREWIAPAVVAYIMSELLNNQDTEKKAHQLIKYFKWTFVPVLNIDGYEYSRNTDRMWRKTRQTFTNSKCVGVDLNRNWDFEWERQRYDSNPCSETYVGSYAFSAPESKAMADYVASRKRVISYLDLHSFSQMWMTPYGSDCRHEPKDNEDIVEAALHAVKSLKRVHDKQFEIAPVCESVSETSGDSIEWLYTKQHVKYSYEVQLRDTGSYGFLLPPSEILPSGEEMYSAVKDLALFIRSRDGKGKKGT
ncbi:hypothetical protein INT43_002319 [Umbelopsis isabellina]|uniref:Carboxypeptidase M14A n=1 Tax=Mortierella isabellina TaxID=91625 RepID=A0A8H7Q6Z1_MORIS|nr:hypothetical protein INT43_002319 [Umbelopsis isabellina]